MERKSVERDQRCEVLTLDLLTLYGRPGIMYALSLFLHGFQVTQLFLKRFEPFWGIKKGQKDQRLVLRAAEILYSAQNQL